MAKISEKRLLEWWEAPGIDGREAFDEEILYLNSLAEELDLPRWALSVRDLMPRWGFEPCSHLFPVGLEQVITMIGEGKACPRVGACGEVPLTARLVLKQWGEALVRWSRGSLAEGQVFPLVPVAQGPLSPEQAEAARAAGQAALALLQGHAALDEALERWAERARFPLTQRLVDDEDGPLPRLLQNACCFNLSANLKRLAQGIAESRVPEIQVCNAALREAPELDPARLPTLRWIASALVHWLQGRPPEPGLEERFYQLLGPQDDVRKWLVASLYKCLKLWLRRLDQLLGLRHRYPSLV